MDYEDKNPLSKEDESAEQNTGSEAMGPAAASLTDKLLDNKHPKLKKS